MSKIPRTDAASVILKMDKDAGIKAYQILCDTMEYELNTANARIAELEHEKAAYEKDHTSMNVIRSVSEMDEFFIFSAPNERLTRLNLADCAKAVLTMLPAVV